ncbi:hypothetical protein GGX14DRAFT_395326 [Mycena pura]|uniref:Uncharacterized protein n=1 Tax=Mycena pura TaxID=153505 RepID=A0AAD6VGT4_9AGAR|nr:hypothetical protein GGX14DRAFT_395326 [Mycena pura]
MLQQEKIKADRCGGRQDLGVLSNVTFTVTICPIPNETCGHMYSDDGMELIDSQHNIATVAVRMRICVGLKICCTLHFASSFVSGRAPDERKKLHSNPCAPLRLLHSMGGGQWAIRTSRESETVVQAHNRGAVGQWARSVPAQNSVHGWGHGGQIQMLGASGAARTTRRRLEHVRILRGVRVD